MKKSIITGVGHFVPEKVVTNADLEKLMDTSDEWIRERTGIEERRYFDPDKDTCANMGVRAAQMALDEAGLEAKDIDFIIFATISADYLFPGSGVLLQREMGMENIGALDIRNACSGFIYALSIGDQYIKSGMYKNILIVGAEVQSSALDLTTRGRNVAVIFGDGAGAVILQASDKDDDRGILSTHLHADGNFAEELMVKEPGSSRKNRFAPEIWEGEGAYPYMNGNLVFKHAVVRFMEVIKEALLNNNVTPQDISLLIPHQANLRISNFVQEKLGLTDDQMYNNIQRYGNTTAASIPIAMSEATKEGKIQEGDYVCLAAFGSGFTWASALIKW